MQLNKTCLKIDKPNAKAMIVGYCKDGKLNQQSIWLAVKDGNFPKLLTLQKGMSYKLSPIGEKMDAENFDMPLKYIAELDSEYFVRDEMALWKTVCSNELFDIWDPEGGPHKRFKRSKRDPANFRIQLLRIYEIDHEFNFNNGELKHAGDIFDQLIPPIPEVNIIRPVITEGKFRELKELLEDSVEPYRTRPVQYFVSAPKKTPLTIDAITSEDIELLESEYDGFSEGLPIIRSHKVHERKPQAGIDKKKKVLDNTGKLACEVCGFDFHATYGELGRIVAECHHLVPLSELTESKLTRLEDLAIVCANCHRMLHRGSPWKTVEELKKIIK
jgi:hypothetical protein